MRDALGEWRQDALLIGVSPLLCWPALIGALITRPAALRVVLLVLLCLPVLVALRELYAVRRVRRVLGEPGLRWTPYDAEVLRGGGLRVVPLGRRVLRQRAWTRTGPPPAERLVWLAGDPGRGAVVWAPGARELVRARGRLPLGRAQARAAASMRSQTGPGRDAREA
ncbi:hypothetical protein ACFXDJ_10580 [Streptomyces sp. NPDC059443]|uniref:hypothetical protein n=1 Tax=unclassified Streptomyces TaxID=2593676 RepID=UPI0036AC0DEB